MHVQDLLSSLPEAERRKVADIWNALLAARRDCEAMAARGVRVSRDVSRDWQETVSDLIDRVVTQDSEIANLKQQVSLDVREGAMRGEGAGCGLRGGGGGLCVAMVMKQ